MVRGIREAQHWIPGRRRLPLSVVQGQAEGNKDAAQKEEDDEHDDKGVIFLFFGPHGCHGRYLGGRGGRGEALRVHVCLLGLKLASVADNAHHVYRRGGSRQHSLAGTASHR